MPNDNEYKLKNGTIVNITDLSNLSADERTELFITPLNMYQGLQIKHDLADIKTSLTDTVLFIKTHNSKCPIAVQQINDMISSRMKTNIKETILTSGNIAKALTTIFFLVLVFGSLLFLVLGEIR
jgi:hypothetical protein